METIFSIDVSSIQGAVTSAYSVPWVSSLPINTNAPNPILVLQSTEGLITQGMYILDSRTNWRYVAPYSAVTDSVRTGANLTLYQSVTAPVTPAEGSVIYRNGILFDGTVVDTSPGIVWAVFVPAASGGTPYILPVASAGTLGGVKIGTGINVAQDGTISANVGSGTVTSVGLTLPAIFTVTGSPITTTGTLTATLASQAEHLFLASPSGAAGVPTMRAIAATDLPIATGAAVGAVKQGANVTIAGDGTISVAASGTGTVTSVGLTLPSIFTVSNSPVTGAGSLTAVLASAAAGLFLASPTGAAGAPALRAIVAADLPIGATASLGAVKGGGNVAIAGDGTLSVTLPTAATPSATVGTAAVAGAATTFMRSDGAPAINLGIVPTWTGAHTFSGAVNLNGANTFGGASTVAFNSTPSFGVGITVLSGAVSFASASGVTVPTLAAATNTTGAASTAMVHAAIVAGSGLPYDIKVPPLLPLTVLPAVGTLLWTELFNASVTIPAGAGTSRFQAALNSGTAVINILHNNNATPVGTITFTASGTGVVDMLAATTFVAGDNIEFTVASTDGTISGVYGTLTGART